MNTKPRNQPPHTPSPTFPFIWTPTPPSPTPPPKSSLPLPLPLPGLISPASCLRTMVLHCITGCILTSHRKTLFWPNIQTNDRTTSLDIANSFLFSLRLRRLWHDKLHFFDSDVRSLKGSMCFSRPDKRVRLTVILSMLSQKCLIANFFFFFHTLEWMSLQCF